MLDAPDRESGIHHDVPVQCAKKSEGLAKRIVLAQRIESGFGHHASIGYRSGRLVLNQERRVRLPLEAPILYLAPIQLAVQATGLSSRGHGFKSRWEHQYRRWIKNPSNNLSSWKQSVTFFIGFSARPRSRKSLWWNRPAGGWLQTHRSQKPKPLGIAGATPAQGTNYAAIAQLACRLRL